MPPVFVDTVAWVALVNTRDQHHTLATEVMDELRSQQASLVTTEFVLLEVADALSEPMWRSKTVAFINGLRQLPILQIIPSDSILFNQGWNLYSQRPDKSWSLTDCISFAAMTQDRITTAFTSDRPFEQAGFSKLL